MTSHDIVILPVDEQSWPHQAELSKPWGAGDEGFEVLEEGTSAVLPWGSDHHKPEQHLLFNQVDY